MLIEFIDLKVAGLSHIPSTNVIILTFSIANSNRLASKIYCNQI